MQTLVDRVDELAQIGSSNPAVAWLERTAFVFLILTVVFAPHSIAATQTAWLIGMFAWIVRLFFRQRIKFRFTALDAALWGFFGWSVITSVTSYAPDISINKLRGVAVFLIFYFVIYNVRSRRVAHVLAFTLIASCMVNVLWVPVQRLIGRGVEIHGLASDGALAKALLAEGDTLLEANGTKLHTPEDVVAAIEQNERTKIKFYRPDFDFVVEVKRSDLLNNGTPLERLGVSSWKKSRNWRSSGFFGHYTTYADVLQLIASLVFGLLIAGLRNVFSQSRKVAKEFWVNSSRSAAWSRRGLSASLLVFCLAAMSLALLLTVTRGPQLAFLISCASIVLIGLGRKWVFAAIAVGLPLALIGVLFLQQSRQVGFFDTADDSTKWRQTVWREGFDLWTENPRHFLLGVGMDSIKRHAPDWHLFDDGRLPMGHFHSTPLNLLVERGLPALLLWLMIVGIYAGALWRALSSENPRSKIQNPTSRGILLGCLGGTIGFFVSGLVHYNLGDQEVAMVFFILMGIGRKLIVVDS
ncbi:MAG TPA: O-antigen ligase family protein [Pyrinomonadaceae bacterium]